jgi:hypothetical protein
MSNFPKLLRKSHLETAIKYLSAVPGSPPLKKFKHPDVDIHTIIVNGMDEDIFVTTNQYVVQSRLRRSNQVLRLLVSLPV